MKPSIPILIFSLQIIFLACETSNNHDYEPSIVNTKWTLSRIVDNKTKEVIEFPAELDPFEISFKQYGIIELSGFCNYSFCSYSLQHIDSLQISNIGPGTEIYCPPKPSMDWESLFINSLRESSSYYVDKNRLCIVSNGAYTLVFDFIENFDDGTGNLLFYSNLNVLNCPSEIAISINSVKIDTLTSESVYSNSICATIDDYDIGVIFDLPEGLYNYGAKDLTCNAVNKTVTWTCEVFIYKNKCTSVFLNVIPQ